jgi:hypothetical protein
MQEADERRTQGSLKNEQEGTEGGAVLCCLRFLLCTDSRPDRELQTVSGLTRLGGLDIDRPSYTLLLTLKSYGHYAAT